MDEAFRRNRELWDAWTKIHVGSPFYDVPSFRSGERGFRLADYERDEIGSVEGKILLHLQCHFGRDTLSWARLGAAVTGVHFSEEAITAARGLAADLAIPATFIAADLYELPTVLDGEFDVVYVCQGVLGWLPARTRLTESKNPVSSAAPPSKPLQHRELGGRGQLPVAPRCDRGSAEGLAALSGAGTAWRGTLRAVRGRAAHRVRCGLVAVPEQDHPLPAAARGRLPRPDRAGRGDPRDAGPRACHHAGFDEDHLQDLGMD